MAASTDIDSTTYDLKLALPLAGFFMVFFLAPLAILIYVSLHTDESMKALGFTQYAKFLLDPFSLQVLVPHAVDRRRGDAAVPAARPADGLGLRARAALGAGDR